MPPPVCSRRASRIPLGRSHVDRGVYVNRGCNDAAAREQAYKLAKEGITRIGPGSYDYYTQYIYWDAEPSEDETLACPDGPYALETSTAHICFTGSEVTGPLQGVITVAARGEELEMRAPFRGLFVDEQGQPILARGRAVELSAALATSGQYSSPADAWASDTADPIVYYVDYPHEWYQTTTGIITITMLAAVGLGIIIAVVIYYKQPNDYEEIEDGERSPLNA